MSIAEKLTTIAENQQRVYDAGYESGYSDGGSGGSYDLGWSEGYSQGYAEGEENGWDSGYSSGWDEGYSEGEVSGIEQGKQAQEDAFWDMLQRKGTRNDYQYAFLQWDAEEIKPKYPIKTQQLYATFTQNNKLKRLTESMFDLSAGITHAYSAVAWCPALEEVDVHIVLTENAPAGAMEATFNNCTKLKTIKKITSVANVQYARTFNQCTALESVIFDGVIGTSGLNLQHSTKLNKASIDSIINALSTTTSGLSITLSKTAVTNAFGSTTASEWTTLVSSRSNWTISLV